LCSGLVLIAATKLTDDQLWLVYPDIAVDLYAKEVACFPIAREQIKCIRDSEPDPTGRQYDIKDCDYLSMRMDSCVRKMHSFISEKCVNTLSLFEHTWKQGAPHQEYADAFKRCVQRYQYNLPVGQPIRHLAAVRQFDSTRHHNPLNPIHSQKKEEQQ